VDQQTKRKDKQNIEEVIENLDNFILQKNWTELCCAKFSQRSFRTIQKIFSRQEIVELLRSNEYMKTPVIAVYYLILLTAYRRRK